MTRICKLVKRTIAPLLLATSGLLVTSIAAAGPASAKIDAAVGHPTEVPVEANAPALPGHPVSSVVVTQCNLLVVVYMTMPDGKLLRFDSTASLPADQLLSMAYTATRSERVEVSCQDTGAVGYEQPTTRM
jgi:hypothetical protein